MHPTRIRATSLAVLLYLGAGALAFGEGTEPAASTSPKKVNVNTASATELTYLPRIGSKVANLIVERRKEKPFARAEELMEVKGIGEKLFLTLKPYVSISGPTTLTSKIRLSSTSPRRSSPPTAKEKPANAVPVGKGR